MREKTAWFILIILSCYGALLLQNPSEGIKMAGYNSFLKYYADYRLKDDDIEILYNPDLRNINIDLKTVRVKASLPNQESSYSRQMEDFMQSDGQVLVECSGLDSWHTSAEGRAYLPLLRAQAYRVVIFDGGHHLPTLGISPDIIIVPEYKGYAVHGYMQDGLRVDRLLKLLRDSQSPTILVTVSRWRLVKTDSSLTGITRQVLAKLSLANKKPEDLTISCAPRISKYHSELFVYVNQEYANNMDVLVQNCSGLGLSDVNQVNLAFDYAYFSPEHAAAYVLALQKRLGRNVVCLNEPVKVRDLIFRDR